MNTVGKKLPLPKGPGMEERVRQYFLSLGYYVLRGVRFKYNEFDVTDVDLWLYSRPSPLTRIRLNVDVKNRKTPQALERIFWTKGLQLALGLEGCFVATTDSRPDVREFGLKNDVGVLDGPFLSRLDKSSKPALERISEEEFLQEIDRSSVGKLGGDWKGRYEEGKARVLTSLDFDGCNSWLRDTRFFLEQVGATEGKDPAAWRLVYASIGMLLIGVDFQLRRIATLEADQRRIALLDGFRFGHSGRAFAEKITAIASRIVAGAKSDESSGRHFADELMRQAEAMPADILAEYFSKNSTQSHLLDVAREFEANAYALSTPVPSKTSTACQSVLGVVADFFSMDRKRVLV
jgi:hypothetical protein